MGSYEKIKHLKVLIPTLREKKRYVAVRIISEETITYEELEKAFWETLHKVFGHVGSAYFSVWILKDTFNENKKFFIIKCNHLSLPFVLSTLGFIKQINNKKVTFEIVKISGTIKSIREFLTKG